MTQAMAAGIARDSSDIEDETQIVGRQIWRIVPYVTRYWQRAVGGIVANIGARAFDLIPFIAIGMAADYYNPNNSQFTNSIVEKVVTSNSIPKIGPIASEKISFEF